MRSIAKLVWFPVALWSLAAFAGLTITIKLSQSQGQLETLIQLIGRHGVHRLKQALISCASGGVQAIGYVLMLWSSVLGGLQLRSAGRFALLISIIVVSLSLLFLFENMHKQLRWFTFIGFFFSVGLSWFWHQTVGPSLHRVRFVNRDPHEQSNQ